MSDPTATSVQGNNSRENNDDSPAPDQGPPSLADLEARFVPMVQTTATRTPPFPVRETVHPLAQHSVSVLLNSGQVVSLPLQHHMATSQPRVTVTSSSHNIPGTNVTPGQGRANVQIHVAQLPPLTPQPVGGTSAASSIYDDNEAFTHFKCTLCCEFMSDPVGCSSESCSSRFCHKCLVRAALESTRGSTTTKPRCPTCRVEFSRMVRDERLTREMLHGPTVACRHEGCPQELKLNLLHSHESICSFEKVKCRYTSFGCPWVGRRGDVIRHEANDCALEKVKFLVQGLRKLEADHSTRLSILQQQQAATLQMQQVYQQNAQRDLLKSSSNLFDLFQYCHVTTCATNHFLQTKERWQPFFRSNEGHAALANFLVLLPSVLTSGMLMCLGCQSFLKFCFDQRASAQTQDSIATIMINLLLEDSLVGILSGVLMVLLLIANFVDSKSSITWARFPAPVIGSPPLICDVMALTVFTMHVGILEYYGAAGKSLVVWILLAWATTFYPAVILTMSHDVARTLVSTPSPTLENIMTKARSLEPVLFGLQYSLVGTWFGIFPTMDAAAIRMVAQKLLPHTRLTTYLASKHCFLDGLPQSFLLAYLGCKSAILCVNVQDWKDNGDWSFWTASTDSGLWSLAESLFAFGALLATSLFLNLWLSIGIAIGHAIIQKAESTSSPRPEGSTPSPDYHLLGMTTFGLWVSVLGILLHVR